MNEKILSEILEQLKIQTQMALESIEKSESLRRETKERFESSNKLIEKQNKDSSLWKYYLLGFFAVLIGITIVPKYMDSQRAKEFEKTISIDASKTDSIRMTYALNMRYIQTEFEEGSFKDVIQKKNEIINRYPHNPDMYFILGVSYFNIGLIAEAEPMFMISDSLLPDPRNVKYLNAIKRRKVELKNM